ncbi:hypothetical protein D3C78_396580 [compost metagenome]
MLPWLPGRGTDHSRMRPCQLLRAPHRPRHQGGAGAQRAGRPHPLRSGRGAAGVRHRDGYPAGDPAQCGGVDLRRLRLAHRAPPDGVAGPALCQRQHHHPPRPHQVGSGQALVKRHPQGVRQDRLPRLPLPDPQPGSPLRPRGAQLHVPHGAGRPRLHAGDDVRRGALHGSLHQRGRGVHDLLQVDKPAALHPHHDLLGPAVLRRRLAQPETGSPLHGCLCVAGPHRRLRRLHLGHRLQHG